MCTCPSVIGMCRPQCGTLPVSLHRAILGLLRLTLPWCPVSEPVGALVDRLLTSLGDMQDWVTGPAIPKITSRTCIRHGPPKVRQRPCSTSPVPRSHVGPLPCFREAPSSLKPPPPWFVLSAVVHACALLLRFDAAGSASLNYALPRPFLDDAVGRALGNGLPAGVVVASSAIGRVHLYVVAVPVVADARGGLCVQWHVVNTTDAALRVCVSATYCGTGGGGVLMGCVCACSGVHVRV
jgi:hypothetical protein